MARSLVNTNTIFFLLILFILVIFFYNVFHFTVQLRESQCNRTVRESKEELELTLKRLKEAERALQTCPVRPPESTPTKPHKVPPNSLGNNKYSKSNPPTIPVLVMACDRADYLQRTLDILIQRRPSKKRFPILVSQGCGNEAVSTLLKDTYPKEAVALKHYKNQGIPSYFAIAQHYGWALAQVFTMLNFEAVIIVEDDMEISVDFFEYFQALYPILRDDPSIYCISSWNDNGMTENVRDPKAIYRTDVFPGLGWMMTRDLWEEIGDKWPEKYWDEFMREPGIRNDRQCLYPEISRNKNIGERGTSERQFWDKISRIQVNTEFVNFTSMDMTYLLKENYEETFLAEVNNAQIVPFTSIQNYQDTTLRILYDSLGQFKNLANMFGIMDDEKNGLPRTSYKRVVTFYSGSNKIFLTPEVME